MLHISSKPHRKNIGLILDTRDIGLGNKQSFCDHFDKTDKDYQCGELIVGVVRIVYYLGGGKEFKKWFPGGRQRNYKWEKVWQSEF
jgi:hypothetical protein